MMLVPAARMMISPLLVAAMKAAAMTHIKPVSTSNARMIRLQYIGTYPCMYITHVAKLCSCLKGLGSASSANQTVGGDVLFLTLSW